MNPLLCWLTSPEWTHVVSALLHSLWQGAILAIALAVLMRRLTNPVTRYRCALGALGVIVIAGIITWAMLNVPESSAPTANSPALVEADAGPATTTSLNPSTTDKVVAIGLMTPPAASTHWTAWLALAWMVGTVVMLLRAGIKVAGAENLRRSCQPLKDERMLTLVAEACRAVDLARRIRVAVTDKLTSPAVVGILVPTLILPLSLFSALTPEQIRFVLLHELAHIRRGDYLANLFQLFAEALLFFNPAVWWISHQIRREREACCDALAIELSGAPADYAKTLVRVAENILQPTTNAALAFGEDSREPSPLADRVQRLLVPGYRPTLRLTWRAMLTSLLVGGALLVLSAVGTRNTVGAILTSSQSTNSPVLPRPGIDPNVQPRVSGDDSNIQTTLIPTLTEFVGYDLATAATFVPTAITRAGQGIDSVLPLPIFRVRQITMSNNVGDGQTNVPGGLSSDNVAKLREKVPFLGELPLVGKLFTSESWATRQTWYSGDDSFSMSNWTVGGQNQTNQQWFWYRTRGTNHAPPTSTGILTEPQFREVLKTVELRDDINLLADSPIMIASNREAQIRATLINLNNPSIYSPPVTNAPANKTPDEPLFTRTFNLPVKFFYEKIVTNLTPAELNQTISDTNRLMAIHETFRAWVTNAGVNLDPQLGKSTYYSIGKGNLWVRATSKELDAIEAAIQALTKQPPQVNLKVRWVEIPQALANDLLLQTPTNALPPPILSQRDSSTILSEDQMTKVLERIKSRSGLELLSEGQVTTLTERQAQIQVAEMKTIVTGINPKALTPPGMTVTNKDNAEYIEATSIPFGPVLDLFPKVSPDQTTISLRVIPTITEFLGYDKRAPEVPTYINGKKGKTTLPLPRYRTQQMTNDCVLRDGQTLVLGHLTTTEVAKKPDGTFQTTDVTSTKTNNLYVFVTATLIDPAGNRLDPSKTTPPTSR